MAAAPAFLASLEEAPAVFFFDDPAAGNRLIAKGLRERGSLIYFEPSKLVSNTDYEAVAVSDIIKFSDENIPDVSFADAYQDKVFIQTMGAKGVRFKYKGKPWEVIEARPVEQVVDAEGAGDWFTAAFINDLVELGGKTMRSLYNTTVWDACSHAMGWSARGIAHMGSKGLIPAHPYYWCADYLIRTWDISKAGVISWDIVQECG